MAKVRAVGSRVRTPDGNVGVVWGRSKRKGVLYLSVKMANGGIYSYRADACEAA